MQIDVKNKEQKIYLQSKTISDIEQKNSALKKQIKNTPSIPNPSSFERQGIPESLATRYYLIYIQLDLLAETAGIPERKQQWLRNRMREGVLHHVLERYTLLGLDNSFSPPKIAAQFSISIDWEKSQLFSELKTINSENKLRNAYSQKTMALANAFSRIVEQENLKIRTRLKAVTKPTLNAILTIGTKSNIPSDHLVKMNYQDFNKQVRKTLHLADGDHLEWRKGNETTLIFDSDITPELIVELKYVEKLRKIEQIKNKQSINFENISSFN